MGGGEGQGRGGIQGLPFIAGALTLVLNVTVRFQRRGPDLGDTFVPSNNSKENGDGL